MDDGEAWEARQPDLRMVSSAESDELMSSMAIRARSTGGAPFSCAASGFTARLSELETAGFELDAVVPSVAPAVRLGAAVGTRRVAVVAFLPAFKLSEAPKSSASWSTSSDCCVGGGPARVVRARRGRLGAGGGLLTLAIVADVERSRDELDQRESSES